MDAEGQPGAAQNEPIPAGVADSTVIPRCPDATHGEEKDNRKCKTPGKNEHLLQKDYLTKDFKMKSN